MSTRTAALVKTQGIISIAFDDGWQNQYDNAYPLLSSRGMNATFYIISSRVNTTNYMTVAELQTLQNSGSEIGSHSVSHPDFTTLSDAQIQNESQLSKQTLQSWGLSVNDFAYPYGVRNNHTDSIVAKYYQSARSGYVGPYIIQLPTSQFLLPGFAGETGDTTALSKAENMVDQVSSSNGWTIIFFHNILPTVTNNFSMSTKDFASFLDYVSSKGVRTLTVNQALNLQTYSPPSIVINPSSASMGVGQSQTFNASVSGGTPPYSYKWYLNNSIIPGSAASSYTYVPPQTGTASIYLNVTDGTNTSAKSNTVNVQVYKQYSLYLSTNSGIVSPSNSSYNENSTVSITATPLAATTGERYTWLGWTGNGAGSYTGMNNPAQITM
ncbi:MAG TPA: polysaccharide deacetylase family protein, partial [Candidatus Acidoferrum sp.]|nr:polysaccharide deacetylase family protein [Candidatus Acidoferrum sp.]